MTDETADRPTSEETVPDDERTDHLVVGIDGSEESAVALRWAVDQARRRGCSIKLVYALLIPVVSDAYGMVMTRPDVDELASYTKSLLAAAEEVVHRAGSGSRRAQRAARRSARRGAGGRVEDGARPGGRHSRARCDLRQGARLGQRAGGHEGRLPRLRHSAGVESDRLCGGSGGGRRGRFGSLGGGAATGDRGVQAVYVAAEGGDRLSRRAVLQADRARPDRAVRRVRACPGPEDGAALAGTCRADRGGSGGRWGATRWRSKWSRASPRRRWSRPVGER